MTQILELVPIVLFFVAYQMDGETVDILGWSHTFDGIFSATAILILATLAQVFLTGLLTRKIEKRLIWTGAAVVGFGGATLLLRDQLFIQWKPTVFNWAMALAFTGSQFVGERNLLERIMGSQLALPRRAWRRVCWVWSAHFTVVGALNLFVAYRFEESFWVSYKLYSSIGFTLFIMVVTVVMITPWMKDQTEQPDRPEPGFRP